MPLVINPCRNPIKRDKRSQAFLLRDDTRGGLACSPSQSQEAPSRGRQTLRPSRQSREKGAAAQSNKTKMSSCRGYSILSNFPSTMRFRDSRQDTPSQELKWGFTISCSQKTDETQFMFFDRHIFSKDFTLRLFNIKTNAAFTLRCTLARIALGTLFSSCCLLIHTYARGIAPYLFIYPSRSICMYDECWQILV